MARTAMVYHLSPFAPQTHSLSIDAVQPDFIPIPDVSEANCGKKSLQDKGLAQATKSSQWHAMWAVGSRTFGCFRKFFVAY